jgi:magnesium transporter
MATIRSEARLQESLAEIKRLLDRHRVLETLTHRQEGPRRDLLESLQHRQNLAELQKGLRAMHAADVAYALEALPLDDRRTVWEQVPADRAGLVFVEVSDAVRESLVDFTSRERLVEILVALDPEDLRYVSDALPEDVVVEIARMLDSRDRTAFEDAIRYDEDCVGHYMTHEWVAVPETHTIQQVLADLRALSVLPPQTDRVYIVDVRNVLRGAVSLQALLLSEPSAPVVSALSDDTVTFGPTENASDAVKAFERYDLVSAPVVDNRGKLVGRLTVDTAMDVLRDESNLQALKRAGLSRDEDLFALPWDSARNRWPWLAVNLITAFIASRVIGQFEGAIQELAALAALMPIVASVGGNTGNQTMALVIRALAVDRIQPDGTRRLLRKELAISLLNGLVWGLVVGVLALALYSNLPLGIVMSSAVVLNLVVAALAGVAIPVVLHGAGRDPAYGSSVLLTFITDAMGFFFFLGLATVFLL